MAGLVLGMDCLVWTTSPSALIFMIGIISRRTQIHSEWQLRIFGALLTPAAKPSSSLLLLINVHRFDGLPFVVGTLKRERHDFAVR